MVRKSFYVLKTKEIYDKFKDGKLIVDSSYQRKKIWNETDRIRLIETILMGYLIPSLYFWDAEIDVNTGDTITHIVDGQQRVSAIADFLQNDFSLKGVSLTDKEVAEKYINRKFSELEVEDRVKIWGYEIPIVQLDDVESIDAVKSLFYRLNLTDYNLLAQEKRHSQASGKFSEYAIEIAENDFWSTHNLFNSRDLKRMRDIEFTSTLILLAKEGIINQTTQTPLNNAYDDYKEGYEGIEKDVERVYRWIDTLDKLITDNTIGFLQKKSQLYTVFSVIDYFERKNIVIDAEVKERFEAFVERYNKFKNQPEISEDNEETIRKYKLAASEGLNKLKNRKIRFDILKEILIKGLN